MGVSATSFPRDAVLNRSRSQAPGSGPGGRRFKSSLPDHLFSITYHPFLTSKNPVVGKNATLSPAEFIPVKNLLMNQQEMHMGDSFG